MDLWLPRRGRGHEVRSCLIGMTGLTNHVCDHTYIYVNLFSADRIGPRPLSPLRVPLPAARCPLPATRRQPTAPPPGSRREGHDGARPPSWRTPTGTTRGAAPVIVRATMLAPACAQPVSRVPAANDCRTTPRIWRERPGSSPQRPQGCDDGRRPKTATRRTRGPRRGTRGISMISP